MCLPCLSLALGGFRIQRLFLALADRSFRGSIPVLSSVTFCAARDEIQFRIFPAVAAKLLVVDFQIRHRATGLTPPAIATKNLPPKSFVGIGIKS